MPDSLRKLLGMGLWTLLTAIGVAFVSNTVISKVGLVPAFSLLVAIIVINILADIVGTSAAAAEEAPLHAMATNRVAGAREAIQLVRRADLVANVANDLLGDVLGTVGGAVGAAIVVRLAAAWGSPETLTSTLLLSVIAALTVGGKAAAKPFALRRANDVMFLLGRLCHRFQSLTGIRLLRVERGRPGKRKRSR
ncbi:MAG TPA: hypothetical protein GXX28_11130 [Firmicutes bacterium]|nr:hypothetical protein [Bacillota bacterium]